jgi:hypothetical protein
MELIDRLLEALAVDEPHRVIGAAVGPLAEAVNRHDPRVFELPGDFRFHEEAVAAFVIVGLLGPDFLEGHLAVQFRVDRHEHFTQATARMGVDDPKAAVSGRRHRLGRKLRIRIRV